MSTHPARSILESAAGMRPGGFSRADMEALSKNLAAAGAVVGEWGKLNRRCRSFAAVTVNGEEIGRLSHTTYAAAGLEYSVWLEKIPAAMLLGGFGGNARSPRKAAAVRANGAKGGRPALPRCPKCERTVNRCAECKKKAGS